MDGDKSYNSSAISAAQNFLKEKNKPKPPTAQNAKFAADRANEKQNLAAQRAGGNSRQVRSKQGRLNEFL